MGEKILKEINTLSRTLQPVELDLMKAFDYVDHIMERFNVYRSDAKNIFNEIFNEANEIAEQYEIEVNIPRICRKQVNRPNYKCESNEDYFRVRVYIPFLDHIISSLEENLIQSAENFIK